MMALSGVRSSWLILAKKRDLPAFKLSAASLAATNSASRAASMVESRRTPTSRPSDVRLRARAQQRSGARTGAKTQVEAPEIRLEASAAVTVDWSAATATSTSRWPGSSPASTPSGA